MSDARRQAERPGCNPQTQYKVGTESYHIRTHRECLTKLNTISGEIHPKLTQIAAEASIPHGNIQDISADIVRNSAARAADL